MTHVKPEMFVIAGAPGSGKSTLLPVSQFGVDFFNADDEAAKRNNNSYLITLDFRSRWTWLFAWLDCPTGRFL